MRAAFVTGGAKRIGREIAFFFAEKGYDIALHYHSSPVEAKNAAEKINSAGRQSCELFKADLSSAESANKLINDVFMRFPECCVLINNASVFQRVSFSETTEAFFDRVFQINFKTPFFLTQQFSRFCENGLVINLLDTKISKNDIPYFVYLLTKKALADFTLMAAADLGPKIRVNGICPGLILPSESGKESFERMALKIPALQTGSPENIVKAVRYLEDNEFITGEILYVDGGEKLL